MKLNKTLMIATLAVGSLFAGSIAQAQTDTNTPPAGGQGNRGGRQMTIEMVSTQLALTDEQKTKVKPIIEDLQKKMTDMRADTSIAQADRRTKSQEIRADATAKLKAILTPEQLTKWEAMGQRRRGGAGAAGATPPPAADTAPKN